jgi:hypothetical protein
MPKNAIYTTDVAAGNLADRLLRQTSNTELNDYEIEEQLGNILLTTSRLRHLRPSLLGTSARNILGQCGALWAGVGRVKMASPKGTNTFAAQVEIPFGEAER